jgi:hypothetical protein
VRRSVSRWLTDLERQMQALDPPLDPWHQTIYDGIVRVFGQDIAVLCKAVQGIHWREIEYIAWLVESHAPHAVINAEFTRWETTSPPKHPRLLRYQQAVKAWWMAHQATHEVRPFWRWDYKVAIHHEYALFDETLMDFFVPRVWDCLGGPPAWAELSPDEGDDARWHCLWAAACLLHGVTREAPSAAEAMEAVDVLVWDLWQEWQENTQRAWTATPADQAIVSHQPSTLPHGPTQADWRAYLGTQIALYWLQDLTAALAETFERPVEAPRDPS